MLQIDIGPPVVLHMLAPAQLELDVVASSCKQSYPTSKSLLCLPCMM